MISTEERPCCYSAEDSYGSRKGRSRSEIRLWRNKAYLAVGCGSGEALRLWWRFWRARFGSIALGSGVATCGLVVCLCLCKRQIESRSSSNVGCRPMTLTQESLCVTRCEGGEASLSCAEHLHRSSTCTFHTYSHEFLHYSVHLYTCTRYAPALCFALGIPPLLQTLKAANSTPPTHETTTPNSSRPKPAVSTHSQSQSYSSSLTTSSPQSPKPCPLHQL